MAAGKPLGAFGRRGDRNTHLLGTILEALCEGGVRGSAGLGAGAALHHVLGEMALEDANMTLGFAAVVGHSDGEAVCGHLCLHRCVVWCCGDGDCDGRVWKKSIQ